MTNWTLTEDRWPDLPGSYFATLKNNNGRRWTEVISWTGHHWDRIMDEWAGDYIVAWRPIDLPDPYWGEY